MRVRILGNGGAISNGLPYNSLIIDDTILVETPPDIMNSLFRENIPVDSIENIYISHMHGDHTFGFPFLALRIFYDSIRYNRIQPVTVYLPSGGDEYLNNLMKSALSSEHPCIRWINENWKFINTSLCDKFNIYDYTFRLYRMEHPLETYGFAACKNSMAVFAYTADTIWCRSVEEIIGTGAGVILLDMNGEPDDPMPVHMGEKDVFDKGFSLLKSGTTLYGMHLKISKVSIDKRIKYPNPGDIIYAV